MQTRNGKSGELVVQFPKMRGKNIKWYLLHPLYSFDNKAFHNVLETKADRNMYTKHSMDFEMCSICLFCVLSEVPKAPFLLALHKVKTHPL